MKNPRLWIVSIFLTSAALFGQSGESASKDADKSSVRLKCSFNANEGQIEFQLKNASKSNLMLSWNGPAASNTVSMVDASGNSVSYTNLGKASQRPLPPLREGELRVLQSSVREMTLHPGEEKKEVIPLDLLFVLPKEGGVFQVRAGRRMENFSEELHSFDDRKTLWCEPMTIRLSPLDK